MDYKWIIKDKLMDHRKKSIKLILLYAISTEKNTIFKLLIRHLVCIVIYNRITNIFFNTIFISLCSLCIFNEIGIYHF